MTALSYSSLRTFESAEEPLTAADDFVRPGPQLPASEFGSGTDFNQVPQTATNPQRIGDFIMRRQAAEYRPFRRLQQWEGVVTDIRDDVFEAELRDLNHPSNPSEFIEMSTDEVSAPDLPLLRAGSVFYWIIGHETRKGQILNVSEVRFKRTPPWSSTQIDAVRTKGKELFERFTSHVEISECRPSSGAG